MRVIAFVINVPVIEQILTHIGEPTLPPVMRPARSPPQVKMDFDHLPDTAEWPEMDQTVGADSDTWE